MRSRSLIRALVLAGALLATVAEPAAAQKSAADKVLADFAADGEISPCKHSSETLRAVLKNIPPDFEQYAPDYSAAIEAALEARARGECDTKPSKDPAGDDGAGPAATPGAGATATPAPAPTSTPAASTSANARGTTKVVAEPPAPVAATATAAPAAPADRALERVATASASNAAPAPVILLALLAGLLGLSALLLLATRRFGWDEGRLAPVAHAWREASFRSSGLWEDFRDWLRVGR